MSPQKIRFDSADLIEKSLGLRFNVPQLGEHVTGFVIRYDGKPYAYVNQCAHVSVELDWEHGQFFNLTKDLLICATHGAQYVPSNGVCVLGPCKGKRLQSIAVTEENGEIIIHLESIT
jgi:nitrite reductase/ring-hydroxylating ferredoxin subunit